MKPDDEFSFGNAKTHEVSVSLDSENNAKVERDNKVIDGKYSIMYD